MNTYTKLTFITCFFVIIGCSSPTQNPGGTTSKCPQSTSTPPSLRQLCPSGIKTDGTALWFRGLNFPWGKGTTIGDITYTPVQVQKLSEQATILDQENVTMCMVLEVYRGNGNATTAELIELVSALNRTNERADKFVSLASSKELAKQASPEISNAALAAVESVVEVANAAKAEVATIAENLPPLDPNAVMEPVLIHATEAPIEPTDAQEN